MKFEVLDNFKLKTEKGIVELKTGQTLEIDMIKAPKLIETGKIRQVENKRQYEPTEAYHELERYIGKPSLNPNGYKCMTCGAIGERYCLGYSDGRWWWDWQCLKCSPYNEPQRN